METGNAGSHRRLPRGNSGEPPSRGHLEVSAQPSSPGASPPTVAATADSHVFLGSLALAGGCADWPLGWTRGLSWANQPQPPGHLEDWSDSGGLDAEQGPEHVLWASGLRSREGLRRETPERRWPEKGCPGSRWLPDPCRPCIWFQQDTLVSFQVNKVPCISL